MTVEMFGYEIADERIGALVERVTATFESGGRQRLFAVNPAKVEFAARDPELRRALSRAEVLYPDGYGICWAHRILTGRKLGRVAGVDLSTRLLDRAAGRGWSIYLLGAREPVNRRVADTIRKRWRGLHVAGRQHGYFDRSEDREVAERIRDCSPDMLFVAMGSPRQEIWIDRHFEESGAGIALGLGGTFDVYAGEVERAPPLLRRSGLEWLYRILSEPDRIRRFLDTHPRFIVRTFRRALSRRRR